MAHDARSGRSIRPWHLLVAVAVVCVLLTVAVVYLLISSPNPARQESELLESFAADTGSIHYCHNGYGKGIDNQTPWWEQTWVADVAPGAYVDALGEALRAVGYEVDAPRHIVDSDDPYNRGRTYWELTGERAQRFTVTARVSTSEPTLNNCFEGFTDFTQGVDPADHESILVIKFRDEA